MRWKPDYKLTSHFLNFILHCYKDILSPRQFGNICHCHFHLCAWKVFFFTCNFALLSLRLSLCCYSETVTVTETVTNDFLAEHDKVYFSSHIDIIWEWNFFPWLLEAITATLTVTETATNEFFVEHDNVYLSSHFDIIWKWHFFHGYLILSLSLWQMY